MLKKIKIRLKRFLYKLLKKTPIYFYWKEVKIKKELLGLKNKDNTSKLLINSPHIETINFNANDICNSKCVMCNIWKQKQEHEITPGELSQVLEDSLFENVKNIGITGGEPTLRKDLVKLYRVFIDKIPSATGFSIITNCIKEKDVIERIDDVIELCKKNNKSFSIMLSLDGFAEVHNKVRGREGNFKSTINVLNYFKRKKINITTACTISKVNVWDLDELLFYLKNNDIKSRFRVAEFINRLYNNDSKLIRNFDDDEKYNLILFFYKLILTYEKNETIIRTYKSIINILSGGKRLIGCPYHSKGIVLNSKGEIAYCAPKSKILGKIINDNGVELYKDNHKEKKRIIENNCDSCIHDYHSPITYNERLNELEEDKWKKIFNINTKIKSTIHKKVDEKKVSNFQIFITGWYGTETVGDKAILGGIVNELKDKYQNSKISIVITSFYPVITERTVKELDIKAKVIDVYSEDFISYLKGSKLVIMGGGPLMDIGALALPLVAFKIAKVYNIKTSVFGCGIGPLYQERFKNTVKEILYLSDEIKLRDKISVSIASSWVKDVNKVKLSGDPAKNYIKRLLDNGDLKINKKENVLKCYVREWTYEYNSDISISEFQKRKIDFERALSNFIKLKALEINAEEIYFDHMHNFAAGNDDRDFSIYFINNYFKDFKIKTNYNKKLSSVESIVSSMLTSKHNICMRFHSVLFADTLETDFTAIDYTRGGKILGYLTDNLKLDNLLSIEGLLKNYSVNYEKK